MAKDKLITIRIEEEKRQAFQEWSKKNEINGATFLYQIIEGCISGNIYKDIVDQSSSSQSELKSIQLSIQKLSKKVEKRISEQENEISTLKNEMSSLKTLLSSQNKGNKTKSTQKIAKRVDKNNENENKLLSDRQLAEILKITPATVNRWRTGKRKPSKKYSDIFNLYDVIDNKWRKKN